MIEQMSITGREWMTPADRKREQRRKASALKCAAALRKAADATNDFLSDCRQCGDAIREPDSRSILIRDLAEYAGFLENKYGK